MPSAPIILVPGFWLGAWAWDEVAVALRAEGHNVTAMTLPGLESVDADRSAITLSDHVNAICETVKAAGTRVVLVVHSGAGTPGYAASDRVPDSVAAMVYVDTGPAKGAINPEFTAVEMPMPALTELAASPGTSLEGVSPAQLDQFRNRAVPQPGAAVRDAPVLTNDARCEVPSVVVCTAMSSAYVKDAVTAGRVWASGFAELRDVTYVDLPTSHWPMWSRSRELAVIIGDLANVHGRDR